MRNTLAYSLTKNSLCPERHNKPDQSQEDFDRCRESPDNAFLCENRRVSSQSKNTRTKRHYQHCFVYQQDVLTRNSNHGVEMAQQKLNRHMCLLSLYTEWPEK